MSELIQKNDNRATIRWKLLTGASALALTAYVSSTSLAFAEDSDQPQIWIELGGQLSRLQDSQEIFAPPLMDARPAIFDPSQKFEKAPLYSIDEEGRISFQPENSNWVFSAAVRYGRSTSKRHVSQQTNNLYPIHKYGTYFTRQYYARKFAETISQNSERHVVLDFQAGKDVGLGMFGKDGSSVVSLGVRIAQFKSNSNVILRSDPDWAPGTKYVYGYHLPTQNYHSNAASFSAQRSFRGLGPSLSWSASTPFIGNQQAGELTVDWGLNAALLFGKQKTRTHHQTTGRYHYATLFHNAHTRYITYQAPAVPDHFRSKSIMVPNVGGFAGISFRYVDAKISVGYKADFFFGAIDGGIDARKEENRGFFGPFASISVGLGD